MDPVRKERYDYRKGNYHPTGSPNSNTSTGMTSQQPTNRNQSNRGNPNHDPEAGAAGKKDEKKSCCSCGCCCRCICYTFLLLILILLALTVVLMFYLPKIPKHKLISADITKSVVVDLTSENSYDIKINRFWGDIQYNKKKLADFNTENVNIVKLDTTRVEILLNDVNLDPALINFCTKNKEFPADVNGNIEFKFLKLKFKKTQQINIPCPPIPKDLPTDLVNNIPAGVDQKDVQKLLQDQQLPK